MSKMQSSARAKGEVAKSRHLGREVSPNGAECIPLVKRLSVISSRRGMTFNELHICEKSYYDHAWQSK